MKQVVVIHGGGTYSTYEEYLNDLRNEKIDDIAAFKPRIDWKATLQDELGAEYEVLQPRMPNKQNAKYIEWKIWFEKIFPFLDDQVILVGHSLGGVFLAKYLAEETFPKKIVSTMLVAAPYDSGDGKKVVEFVLPGSLASMTKRSGKIFLYQSKDDHVVPFAEVAKYQKALPGATARIFDDRGHFNQESFPELVADIKSL